jgi:hypothetical protein
MKLRSSKKVHFEDETVNDGETVDEDETVIDDETVDEDENVNDNETVDDLVENNNLGFVVLIVALFSINYLYGCMTNNSTTSNSTDVIYW